MHPKEDGFKFPAEWLQHKATWLSFPWNKETWEDRLPRVYPSYFQFIKEISEVEQVNINVGNSQVKTIIEKQLAFHNLDNSNILLHDFPTNDSWCRDHGPSFVVNTTTKEKRIVDWQYNAWGGKYPPFNDDNQIPIRVAELLNLKTYKPGIVMEGGSIEVNGAGSLLTSKSCLLNKNRNPHLNQKEIETYLMNFYGVEQILWIEDGIVGDDTDGHVDDTTRFINENTVLTVMESDRLDDNYGILKENLEQLKMMKLLNGESLNIIELPMPSPVIDNGLRLPASYANFYICNQKVLVPIYNCQQDDVALEIIGKCFPNRKVVGIDSTEIIWGLGSLHCLSQQEPEV
ncbi:agmatine deiminase family protein [uncultured Arcticibacterium sp.]|uniref:agmatine deiminase family protein n=1 Tax=uncultured Arcticibacterium sp. TaxID=2173042 RepID=UPI0030F51BDD